MELYSLDEEKTECTLGNREIWHLAGQESQESCVLFLTSEWAAFTYLSLTHGTAKFKQLD